jgi:membrane protein
MHDRKAMSRAIAFDGTRIRKKDRTNPLALGLDGWKDVLKRVWHELSHDDLSTLAASVAFYGFFAIIPALAAIVSIYGLVSDPREVGEQLLALKNILPAGTEAMIGEQLERIASASPGALSGGFILSVMLAIWSASKGMAAIIHALNVAYDEKEERAFFRRHLVTLALTLGAVITLALAIGGLVVLPIVLQTVGLGRFSENLIALGRWPALALFVLFGLAVVYRYAPSRPPAKWRWVTPGSIVATLIWIGASIGFSFYAKNFGSYEKTYGSLGAVAILLFWFYLSAYVILLGAELNAEAEDKTTARTTE